MSGAAQSRSREAVGARGQGAGDTELDDCGPDTGEGDSQKGDGAPEANIEPGAQPQREQAGRKHPEHVRHVIRRIRANGDNREQHNDKRRGHEDSCRPSLVVGDGQQQSGGRQGKEESVADRHDPWQLGRSGGKPRDDRCRTRDEQSGNGIRHRPKRAQIPLVRQIACRTVPIRKSRMSLEQDIRQERCQHYDAEQAVVAQRLLHPPVPTGNRREQQERQAIGGRVRVQSHGQGKSCGQ
jgi:hypothetical protein